MNEAKILRALYLVIGLTVLNLGVTAYLVVGQKSATVAKADATPPGLPAVSKEAALAVAKRMVEHYNARDLDGLYAQFSDVARMQFTKDKLADSVGKLAALVGNVDDYAYSGATAAGSQDGKPFQTLLYRVRLSGGAMPTGELKITVAQESDGLGVYGFFITAGAQ